MSLDWLTKLKSDYADKIAHSPIKVRLIAQTESPFNIAAASARTCYSSKGLLLPEDMQKTEKAREISRRVARSTLKSGHHTTRQHANFVFGLENASRQVIWQILHAHPYYNSEQVSQRYVPIKETENWYSVPLSLAHDERVHALHRRAYATYSELVTVLTPTIEEIYFSIHRLKARNKADWADAIKKRAMEVARYVMPVSTTAYLYHSISALTLMRYVRMMLWHNHEEFTILVIKMLDLALAADPDLANEFPEPLIPPKRTYDTAAAKARRTDFERKLNGKSAALLSSSVDALAASAALGTQNELLGDVFYPGTLDETTRALNHAHFSFAKRLSHTADSQEQRHRTLPGNRPHLAQTITLENEFVTPQLLHESAGAKAIYDNFLEYNFDILRSLWSNESIAREDLAYLLPNAYPIHYIESGDFYNFYHKWKSRLCYNAQEEIFYSAHDEVSAIKEKFPSLASHIGPPCVVRENLKPRCPEGDHFCGIKVWQIDFAEYSRVI